MEVCVCDIGAFPNWKLYKSIGDSVTNMRDSFFMGYRKSHNFLNQDVLK